MVVVSIVFRLLRYPLDRDLVAAAVPRIHHETGAFGRSGGVPYPFDVRVGIAAVVVSRSKG
jgi:hypothetical protein